MILYSANGTPMPVAATAELNMNFSGLIIPYTAKVVEQIEHNLILGADFLSSNQVTIDYKTKAVNIADDTVRLPLQSTSADRNCVTTISSTCLPAYSEALVRVSSPSYFDGQDVILEPLAGFQFQTFALARSMSRCNNGRTICRVLNYSPQTLVLRKGVKVASIQSLNTVAAITPYKSVRKDEKIDKEEGIKLSDEARKMTLPELEAFVSEYKFKINPKVTEKQRLELLRLLYDYKQVFARTMNEIKQYPHYQLKLDLLTDRKVFRRQFRLSEEDARIAQEQIDEMAAAGVIEPAPNAEFNSPIFLVDKKDKTKRMVIDLRQINEIILPKLVQLPKIPELIDQIMNQECNWMSLADLRCGYYQVLLSEESRPLTSFTAPNGLRFCFRTTPFGLSNSPAAMLTILIQLFGGHANSGQAHRIFLYMDDCLCVNATFEEHLETLKYMFETFKTNNLTCNPSKCEFLYQEVEYLGFRLSNQGIKISERKIETIKAIQPPKTKKSLQRILGIFSFWRRYVKNFAQQTANMRQLLLKDAEFRWTEECQKELNYLKQCLISDPILKPINPNRDFIINTDASLSGYSYVIMQYDDDGKLHVVAYGSQATTPSQRKHTPADLELTALVLALKAYEVYLVHRQIFVITDNSRVLHLHKWPVVNARQKRLLTYLMQFRLTIKYVKGSKNLTADALSRIFEDLDPQQVQQFIPAPDDQEFVVAITDKPDKNDASNDDVENEELSLIDSPVIAASDYETDDEFRDIYYYLTQGILTGDDNRDKVTLLLADQFFIDNNRLFKITTPRNKREIRVNPVLERLCVPNKYRFDLLTYFHNNLGHPGVQRLFRSLMQSHYWKKLFYDCYEFCKSCDLCLRAKRNFGARLPPLHPLPVPDKPFSWWCLDHKNLTRKTNQGNVALLVCVEMFSGWPVVIPVPDLTAATTARVFFRHVISVYGAMPYLMTDKSTSFVASFFSQLAKLMKITHRSSSATTSRSNGMAEAMVKKVSDLLKIYASDDLSLEECVPLVEMAIRCTPSTRFNLSPFQILFGYTMSVPQPTKIEENSSFSGDLESYHKWLLNKLQLLHSAVKQNRQEIKQEDKKEYDIKNAVTTPTFKVGDEVLLFDNRIKPHSNRVLTHHNFKTGPFYIADLVQGSADIGMTYRLIDVNSGKTYRRLVPADRLKRYTADRTDLLARLPINQQSSVENSKQSGASDLQPPSVRQDGKIDSTPPSECEQAKRILKEKIRKDGSREYLVLFFDNKAYWCDFVTPALLKYFRIAQERKRKRQRRSRR